MEECESIFAYHDRIALDLRDWEGRVPKEGRGSPLRINRRYKRGNIDDMLMVYIATTKASIAIAISPSMMMAITMWSLLLKAYISQDVYMNCVLLSNGEWNEYTIDAGRIYYAINLDIANRRGESKRSYHSITKDFESELEHFNNDVPNTAQYAN